MVSRFHEKQDTFPSWNTSWLYREIFANWPADLEQLHAYKVGSYLDVCCKDPVQGYLLCICFTTPRVNSLHICNQLCPSAC